MHFNNYVEDPLLLCGNLNFDLKSNSGLEIIHVMCRSCSKATCKTQSKCI